MPVMGGLDAARRIREGEQGTKRHVPIVAMTAHAAAQDQKRCEEAGMDGYLSKPVRQELLRNEIKRVTGNGQQKLVPPAPEASAEKPRHSDWDLKDLMERLDGDQDFLRELLVIFQQDVRVNLQKSRAAIENRDLEGLSRAAHTIKGMLKNLSMGAAAESAAALEKAARENSMEQSEHLLQRLSSEMEEILPEVELQLAEVKP